MNKKITKKQVDEVYNKPINPAKPFERVEILMAYAMQEMKILINKNNQSNGQ